MLPHPTNSVPYPYSQFF